MSFTIQNTTRLLQEFGSRRFHFDLVARYPRLNVCHFSILLLFVAGCNTYRVGGYRAAVPTPPMHQQFAAGVGKADITPPPGYPPGGHSIAAPTSRGQWMRLMARAFLL